MCVGCGTRFTDERWKAIELAGRDTPRETHPHLCDDCRRQAVTAECPAEEAAAGHEHQEHDRAVPEQKAGGTWRSRLRR